MLKLPVKTFPHTAIRNTFLPAIWRNLRLGYHNLHHNRKKYFSAKIIKTKALMLSDISIVVRHLKHYVDGREVQTTKTDRNDLLSHYTYLEAVLQLFFLLCVFFSSIISPIYRAACQKNKFICTVKLMKFVPWAISYTFYKSLPL